MIVSNILNNVYFDKVDVDKRKDNISNHDPTQVFIFIITLILETIIITILIFYMRKIVLLVPSYGSLNSNVFEPNTAVEYTVHIALVFVFLEMIPNFKKQFILLGHLLGNY
jgi:flagellar biosynthesis protein FliP